MSVQRMPLNNHLTCIQRSAIPVDPSGRIFYFLAESHVADGLINVSVSTSGGDVTENGEDDGAIPPFDLDVQVEELVENNSRGGRR